MVEAVQLKSEVECLFKTLVSKLIILRLFVYSMFFTQGRSLGIYYFDKIVA